MTEALEAVFEGPQIATITLTAERRLGKPPMDAKLILLPLRSDLGEITRIMGCFVAHGAIGRTPRRFDVASIKLKSLMAGQTPKLADAPKSLDDQFLGDMGETKEKTAPKPKFRGLHLVKSDE